MRHAVPLDHVLGGGRVCTVTFELVPTPLLGEESIQLLVETEGRDGHRTRFRNVLPGGAAMRPSMDRISAELPVPRRQHQRVKLVVRQAQQALMVAAFDVDHRTGFEIVVDDGLDAPGHAKRRHGAAVAVGEQLSNAVLIGEPQMLAAEHA